MLLASSMIVAMQAGPVYAGDMASDINFLKYTSEAGTESGVELFENFEEKLESDDAELEEGRIAADAAADAAEAAAGTARGYADETESSEVEEAAANAAADAEHFLWHGGERSAETAYVCYHDAGAKRGSS